MRASAACRDDRLILLDRSVREIEAESILLARHPLGERPRLGGGQLQCRGDRYVAAEQTALPRRTFVRRTVGAGEQAFGTGKGARTVGLDTIERPRRRQRLDLPAVEQPGVDAARENVEREEIALGQIGRVSCREQVYPYV